MITWFDYLLSVVIAGMLVFIIGNTRLRTQDASIETAQIYMAKSSVRGLADLIDQDMPNIGSGMLDPNLDQANATVLFFGADGADSVFRFIGFPGPLANPEPHEIEYRWRKKGTVTLSDGYTTVNAYEVERRVKPPGGGYAIWGGNIEGNVTAFRIRLFDNDLQEKFTVAPPGDASIRYVDVSFSMVSPFGTEDLVEQTRWHKRYRPINMADQSRIVIRGLFPFP